ncbi:MAG: hypothetical protein RLZZ44_1462 [Bacteroidota bacterium]|jgi:GT2 family glycosyltransferase
MRKGLKFAVVIATFNREICLLNLLHSISKSKILPDQICIVAAGKDVSQTIKKFDNTLNIVYKHSETANQILQKKEGILLLSPIINHVIFLDDDLIVEPQSFNSIFSSINELNLQGYKVDGAGFNTDNVSKINNLSSIFRFVAKVFLLAGNTPGKILKSGHAVNYLQSKQVCETSWLNGASIWTRECANLYRGHANASEYSAYEDVYFSYSMRKKGFKLFYFPNSKINLQKENVTDYNDYKINLISMISKYYFVVSNKEFSLIALLWSQIGRSFFYLYAIIVQRKKISLKNIFLPLLLLKIIAKRKLTGISSILTVENIH